VGSVAGLRPPSQPEPPTVSVALEGEEGRRSDRITDQQNPVAPDLNRLRTKSFFRTRLSRFGGSATRTPGAVPL